MSAIIRQQLSSVLPAISVELRQGPNLEALPNESSSLGPIGVAAETLSRKLSRAQDLLHNWTLILSSQEKEIREEENDLFANFLVGGKSPSDIIFDGCDLQTKLEIKIDQIRNLAAQALPTSVPPSAPLIRPMINLPALQLPDFDGHDGNWPSFWAAFSHTIHDNSSLTGAQKLTYLVGRLRGSARTLVDGFALTDHNYPIVVDLMKGRFGDDATRADRLRSELFHLGKPTSHSASLRTFSENIDRICRQLESLGNNLDNNPFLTVAIKEKLPTEIKAQLYDKEMEEGGVWSSKQWRERLARVVKLREAVHAPWDNSPVSVQPSHPKLPPRPAEPIRRAFPVTGESRKEISGRECSLCLRKGHQPSSCSVYRTVVQRTARLAEQGRCSICAREGHRQDICTSNTLCFRCGGKHHLLVCPRPEKSIASGSNSVPLGLCTLPPTRGNPPKVTSPVALSSGQEATNLTTLAIAKDSVSKNKSRPTAYLMIKEIHVFNNNGPSPVAVPVFFDPGSQPDFVSTDLVSQINPPCISEENMTVGGFQGNSAPKTMKFASPRYLIRLRRKDGGWESVELNKTERIIPPVEFLKEVNWSPVHDLKMGTTVKEPKILLGVREFWKFFLGKKEVFPGLFRIDTVFGPIFGGEIDRHCLSLHPPPSPALSFACGTVVREEPSDELIRKLWSLESIGICDPLDKRDDDLALALFQDSVTFKEGRYEVGWPWRPGGKDRLSSNFPLAYSRLSALSQKLRNDEELRDKYQAVITDQLERGIIEPTVRTGAKEHFIPHQAVITPKKLRVVYDASAHEKGKASLNELLLPGPNLVPELAGILLRFRASTHPVLGDIEKAFLAVGLREEDREVAKFLWLKNPALPLGPENLAIFRFKRIAFGVNSSPFLLASVLRFHLTSLGDPMAMSRNFYVDNLLLCNETIEEAASAVGIARQVMAKAGMRLREFVAADPAILRGLPSGELLVGDVQKVLGISWELSKEKIFFELPKARDFPPTRRGILGAIASVFDPLGLCCPCLVKAKIFFQSLWDLRLSWDEPIGEKSEKVWAAIIAEWKSPPLLFERLTPCGQADLQLHIFSDAGPNSYAAALYLRAECNGNASVSLIFAKSRLRPKKFKNDELTIPRLELLGLITAVRAKNFVIANFDRPFERIYFWVDSQIVLSWLASKAPQPVFIENRLSEVRKEKGAIFRYVKSQENPADLGTRGTPPSVLNRLDQWHFGPSWLKLPEPEWPNEFRDIVPTTDEIVAYQPIHSISATVPEIKQPEGPPILNPRDFSVWSKLLITTTFVLCFLFNRLGKGEKMRRKFPFLCKLEGADPSSFVARSVAKKWILKREQAGMSPENGTFCGADGLIRLRTRLAYCKMSDNFKNPIVIPRDSWVTRLLILSAHCSLAHSGVDYTMANFLSEFWCIRARRLIKSVLRECPICIRDKAVKFPLPPMPPLPSARTTPSPPFTFIGLDYLGPTLFKSPDGPKKAWVLLFTCLSCRAVHLELVDSLSAADFLLAFRRFVARRGSPKRVWSDNGTQLILGRQILKAYYDFPVEWKLIPPQSPWAGGVYERMVGLVKTAFRRCLGRTTLIWGQLLTLTHEVEAIVNDRPITFVSDDKNGPLPLRPADFLFPYSQNSLVEPEEPEQPFHPSSSEKLAHLWYVANESLRRFWKIWSRDYLLILRGRTKDTHIGPRLFAPDPPKVGDIVLIEQGEFPRNHWPLARILTLLPPDKPRSAKLLLGSGKEWERPVNQLIPLEGRAKWSEVATTASHSVSKQREAEEMSKGEGQKPKRFHWADKPPTAPQRTKAKSPNRYNWALGPPVGAITLALLCLISGGSATLNPLTCEERGIWVFINPKAEGALVCCEGICSSRGHLTPYLLPLPLDLLASGFECHVSYSLMGEKISTQIKCDPVEGCTLITCVFCWEGLLNPHCFPFLLPTLLGTVIGGVGVLFILGCCYLESMLRGRVRLRRFGLPRGLFGGRPQPRQSETSARWRRIPAGGGNETEEENEISFRFEEPAVRNPNPIHDRSTGTRSGERPYQSRSPTGEPPKTRLLTRLGYALSPPFLGPLFVLSFISSVNAGLDVMPILAKSEECFVDHGSTKCRFDSVTSLTLLPVGQKVELVFHTPQAVPMGSLFLALQGLSLRCVKDSLGWTRSYRVNISSILRCPSAGSCYGSFCSDVGIYQYVPELGDQFPGLNFCREASGFIRRGCLSPAYACLFYRVFAEPTSKFVYERFKCPAWQFLLKLELFFELEGAAHREELVLFPGISIFWPTANLSLIFSPGGLPPLPLLSGFFLSNSSHAALAPDGPSYLRCESEPAAQNLNCSLSFDVCGACHTHHEEAVVQCQCRSPLNPDKVMEDPSRVLPNSFSQVPVSYGEGTIWSTVPYTPIDLILKMGGTSLAVRHAPSICTVIPGRLLGCHSCRTGGRFNYTCVSSRGESFASIICEDGTKWVTRCSPKGHPNSVVLPWSHPEVDTHCKVDCLGGDTHFVLKGTLIFLFVKDHEYLPINSKNGKGGNYTGGVTFPQIKIALFQSVGSLPQASLAIAVGLGWVLVFLLAIRYCPISSLPACCCPQITAGLAVRRAGGRPETRRGRERLSLRHSRRARTM